MLGPFIEANHHEIVDRCRAKVADRSTPRATPEIDHGVPMFLGQLIESLRLGSVDDPEIASIAIKHGRDLLGQGFSVSQVVHDYGDVCQTITEMAVEKNVAISAKDFRTLNLCLDNAIAGAVTEYGRGQNQTTLNEEAARGNERLGFLAHELRNLTNTAILAFDMLKTGNVGVAGSTGAVLQRSLKGLRVLIARSFDEVRLAQEVPLLSSFPVSGFIRDIEPAAMQEAREKGIVLVVRPVDEELTIRADRDTLAAVMGNVLQNAFKFTRPHTIVTLRVEADFDRVLIEVEDECGGLSRGNVGGELFHSFIQRGSDRTGLGLGLAFCRWGVEASNGRISARSLPGKGCVFTIDVPRSTWQPSQPCRVQG